MNSFAYSKMLSVNLSILLFSNDKQSKILQFLNQYCQQSMKNQRDLSIKSKKNLHTSSEDQELPSEWASVNKRLEFLEASMVKLQKKSNKLESKISAQEESQNLLKKEILIELENIQNLQNQENQQQFSTINYENLKKDVNDLQKQLKKIEKKNNQYLKEIKDQKFENFNLQDNSFLNDRLEENFQKNQHYIDKAVLQLKKLLKTYVKEQAQIQNKLGIATPDISHKSSRKNLTLSNSSQKLLKPLYSDHNYHNQEQNKSNNEKSPKNSQSRVSYLRQKLKEFEQINKKYEDRPEIKQKKIEQKKVVEKMKNFKNYLEQSESQLEQSNIEYSQNNEMLIDSMTKWKSTEKIIKKQ